MSLDDGPKVRRNTHFPSRSRSGGWPDLQGQKVAWLSMTVSLLRLSPCSQYHDACLLNSCHVSVPRTISNPSEFQEIEAMPCSCYVRTTPVLVCPWSGYYHNRLWEIHGVSFYISNVMGAPKLKQMPMPDPNSLQTLRESHWSCHALTNLVPQNPASCDAKG